MTKALFANHHNMTVSDDGSIGSLQYIQTNIDWMYIAPEDMEITYKNGDGTQVTKQVKTGDIIIQMYTANVKGYQHVVVVSSEDWKNNIDLYMNRYADKKESETLSSCDECSNTYSPSI